MPQVNINADLYLYQRLKEIEAQLTAIQTQQNSAITDPAGNVVIQTGCFPQGPGNTPPVTYGFLVLDDNGDERVMVGLQKDNTYGIEIFDAAGNVRCSLGLLPNSDYGASVSDTLGHSQELIPTVTGYHNGSITVNSATISSYTGSPSVTVETGVSGDYIVTAGSYIGIAGQSAEAYLYDNGTQVGNIFGISGATISANIQSTRQASQWEGTTTPNASHTFTLEYANSTGSSPTATFAAIYLGITPI